ncbi:DUF4189 domain-containing protein [Lysobacter niabensis]|uniref:DUF4189 domain-containing protein n=1 Tax=Agrilutibacter niabensis TaxID=380628 RepID=UPI00361FB0D2
MRLEPKVMPTACSYCYALAFWLFLTCMDAAAEQGCPYNHYPGGVPPGPVCIPMPGVRSSPPEERWSDSWGAIAIDSTVTHGGIGTVVGAKTESMAEQEALQECRSNGGGVGCEVLSSYKNGCGVIAWGASRATTASGATLAAASQLAMRNCQLKTTDCQVFYSECSLPKRE